MKKGFTLVELLIVISIIALLSVFLFSNVFGARDRAKEVSVRSIMHTVQLAIEAYQMDNEVYPIASNLPLESLSRNYLMQGGYLAGVPKNPFTGLEYKDSDLAGKIIYNYDEAKGTYTITGYKRNGIGKIQELNNL
ncbi:MAG: DUF3939 domain-containing protein [Candidatus Margulisiibacteriota bacterium]|jgi:prepilin-type N-terminal cleavage/methylation domain-containing protein